ncbi:MAG: DUF748 domain-containing protein [Ginsengibacter sp.]
MATKIQQFFRKGIVKISLIVIALLAVAITCLHLWFVHNSNRLLIDLVNSRSNGKLKLELSRVNFSFFSNEVKIHRARISSTAKDKSKITYQVSFQKISLSTNSLLSAFFQDALEIHKIKLYDPVVEVYSKQKDTSNIAKNGLSLGAELGKIYHSIEDGIIALNTHSISLENAKIILNNTSEKGKKPLVFSNIFFTLKKMNKGDAPKGQYASNNDILFSSSNQDITFTDGIHQLLFKRLVIQKAKNIILDSCTIIALPTPETHSSYNIHFKRLALIGVNFRALSELNMVKADSVYCEGPNTDLTLNSRGRDSTNVSEKLSKPEKILREFAGDLDIGFLGVMDGDIHLNITGKKRQSNIHSGKVNFQITNLRVNPDSSQEISLKTFDMLIKGYHLYNKDSSCMYSFDSIRFANDKLLLNNFSVHTTSGANKERSYRNFSMPSFELLGVDWPELIFDQNLKANEANLIDPTITYIKNSKVEISKKSLFITSHQNFDDFMDIGSLNIINGNLNIQWGEDKTLQLQGFNLSVYGDNLSDYKRVKLREDIESLFFRQGYLKAGDINARFSNITFKTNAPVRADEVIVNNDEGGIDSRLKDVSIKNIYSEENSDKIVIDGLQWANGNIRINAMLRGKPGRKKTSIVVNNISGKNTQFNFKKDAITCDAFVSGVKATSLQKDAGLPMQINGLKLNGNDLVFSNAALFAHTGKFAISDNNQDFTDLHLENNGHSGTLVIDVRAASLSNNIYSLFKAQLNFNNILLESPKIDFKKKVNAQVVTRSNVAGPVIHIDHLMMKEPAISLQLGDEISHKQIVLPSSKGGEIKSDNIHLSSGGISMETLGIKTKELYIKGMQNDFNAGNGVNAEFSKVNIAKEGNTSDWNAILKRLSLKNSDPYVFNIKKNKLLVKDIELENCNITSSSLKNISELLNANRSAVIKTSKAKYVTPAATMQCNNVNYSAASRELTLDSLQYRPIQSRDAFISANPYQVDYITFAAGAANISGFDMTTFLNGKSFVAQKLKLSRPSISVYRDKLPSFQEGVTKKLFTDQIRGIPLSLSIGEISIDDGKVVYTERNDKSRMEGSLVLTNLKGNISNVTNSPGNFKDSLAIALTGVMLDKADFDFKLKQSYSDKLAGFTMGISLEPAPLSFLNPLLAPLSNVKFTSGTLDKLDMNATGNENAASGKMTFYYTNLHIQLLKNGGVEKTAFIKRRESDLVNFFMLKNDNTSRTGLVYFKRIKDRSFFNYINKIIFSGLATSTGAKSNRRYVKDMRDDGVK